jgi:hypothetical protein
MTRHHPTADAGQQDLFGDPVTPSVPSPRAVSRIESNDVELMHTVAANAARCGYLLVGTSERVYTRVPERHADEVARVPRYEEDAVHQLLRRRWLTTGSQHRVTCGAAQLTGAAVLVPRDTRARVERWQRLHRPPTWPTPAHPSSSTSGRVVPLHGRNRP